MESGRLLNYRVEELEGSFELAQVKLQLEHLKDVEARLREFLEQLKAQKEELWRSEVNGGVGESYQ